MPKLEVVKPKHSLIYSMKLMKNVSLDSWTHEHIQVPGADGIPINMTLHLIAGTREEIREQLLQSIDAFFDLIDEM
jgi:hypothetical protein